MADVSVRNWTWETLKTYRRDVLPIALATVIVALASGAFPIMWQWMIDAAISGTVNYWLAAFVMLLFFIQIAPIVDFLRALFLNRYGYESRYYFLKHVLRLSVAFHKEKESTKVLLEANKGISAGSKLLQLFLNGDIIRPLAR